METENNYNKLLPLENTKIKKGFWKKYDDLVRNVVIPYQWDILNDRIPEIERSGVVDNLKITAGLAKGNYYGNTFQEENLYKWLEAAAFNLAVNTDESLETITDQLIDLIAKCQQDDGYLNTYFTVVEPDKRWTFDGTELYCAGHLMEAAVAYFEATGKRKLLDVAIRFADYLDLVFGPEEHKKKDHLSHPEIELGLIKLYRATGKEKYLNLSKHFIDVRGRAEIYPDKKLEPIDTGVRTYGVAVPISSGAIGLGLKYYQAHVPIREQDTAEGHSVMVGYLYSAVADVAMETGDESLIVACKRIWDNIVSKRMYITGGIGSTAYGEAFTFDYDLPNDIMYTETCASIGLMFFAQRMLQIDIDSKYSDIMEKALYNNVIAGISLDGKRYFYVNPLEVWPEANSKSVLKEHVKITRQTWFKVACCPPNIARLLASAGQYIYSTNSRDEIYIHLFIDNETELNISENKVKIKLDTRYPVDENIIININPSIQSEFSVSLRIPGWCDDAKLYINKKEINISNHKVKGYVRLKRIWKSGDVIEANFPMKVKRMKANPKVRYNIGKVALQRGPLVYCLEEADNGPDLHKVLLSPKSELKVDFDRNLLGGIPVITADAKRYNGVDWGDNLYKSDIETKYQPAKLKFIPYYAWANREPGEMVVWVTESRE